MHGRGTHTWRVGGLAGISRRAVSGTSRGDRGQLFWDCQLPGPAAFWAARAAWLGLDQKPPCRRHSTLELGVTWVRTCISYDHVSDWGVPVTSSLWFWDEWMQVGRVHDAIPT